MRERVRMGSAFAALTGVVRHGWHWPVCVWLAMVAAILVHTDHGLAQALLPSPALQSLQVEAQELYRQRRWPAALAASGRLLAATRAEFGPDHQQVAIQAYGLGLVAEMAGRLDIAEQAWRETVRVNTLIYGKDTAPVTQGMEQLAGLLVRIGRAAEGEQLLRRVLSIRSGLVGAGHSYNASAHAGLGAARLARSDPKGALASFREAVRLLDPHRETQTLAHHVQQAEVRRQVAAFSGLVEAAWQVAATSPREAPALREEAFAAAQRGWTTAAGSALARMATRLGAGDTPLGRRIRRQQDAADRVVVLHQEDMRALADWSAVQRKDPAYSALLEEFSQKSTDSFRNNAPSIKRQQKLVAELQAHLARCPPGRSQSGCANADTERRRITDELGRLSQASSRGSGALMTVHARMQAAEARLPGHAVFTAQRKARVGEMVRLEQLAAAERKAITARFPEYVALIDPAPMTFAETRALLAADEALVTLLVGRTATFVWAVTRETVAWHRIDAGARELAETVAALRRGLDPLAAPPAGPAPEFDYARARGLYERLLGPLEPAISGKRHLIIVPTGPLTSLPLHVLLTGPQPSGKAGKDAIRAAPWLVRRYALSVLPSVPSLAALRRQKLPLRAAEPFLGIGDPALSGPPVPVPQARGAPNLAALYRNGRPDLRALRELVPLPETAAELTAIADALHAPRSALLLRHDATETRVRQTDLARYRVIHFATHGLVAGELSGLAEPALVLTPPIRPSAADDGLLTASEVAALRLAADWVVLSACNTASGSEAGAEALSGLARAFFFSGARTLLVSHWAVNSDAAVWLTTQTFDRLAKSPRTGRAEAFRQTMLAMIDTGLSPSSWAPFVIVGEGAARP